MPEDEPAPKSDLDEMSRLIGRKLSDAEIGRIWRSLEEPKPPMSHLMSRMFTDNEIGRIWDSIDEPKPNIDRLKELLTRREGLPDDAIRRIRDSLPEPKPDINEVRRHLAWLPIAASFQKYGDGPSFQASLNNIKGLLDHLQKIDRGLRRAPMVTRQILNSLIYDDGLTEAELHSVVRKAATSIETYFDAEALEPEPKIGRPLKNRFRNFLIGYLANKFPTLTGRQPSTTKAGEFETFCKAVCVELDLPTDGINDSIRNFRKSEKTA